MSNRDTLITSDTFNYKIIKIEQRIKYLTFGNDYNQEINQGVLPDLFELKFGKMFNKKIGCGVLPNSLKKLTFGDNYNQEIEYGVLPDNLEELRFGNGFNKKINRGVLPYRLTLLKLGDGYNFSLDDELPSTIITLILSSKYDKEKLVNNSSLKEIKNIIFDE